MPDRCSTHRVHRCFRSDSAWLRVLRRLAESNRWNLSKRHRLVNVPRTLYATDPSRSILFLDVDVAIAELVDRDRIGDRAIVTFLRECRAAAAEHLELTPIGRP